MTGTRCAAALLSLLVAGQIAACAPAPTAIEPRVTSAPASPAVPGQRALEELNALIESIDWVALDPGIQGVYAREDSGEIIVQTITANTTTQRLVEAGLEKTGLEPEALQIELPSEPVRDGT